jgi:hypothetical protein
MTLLPGARRGRISELVYHCEVHGLLGRPSASILLARVSSSESEKRAPEPESDQKTEKESA